MSSEFSRLLRKPLNKDDYRAIGVVGILGVLFFAALGFVAVPTWQGAALGAILAIPGSLFAGVLHVLVHTYQQMHPQTTWMAGRKGVRNPLAGVAILLVVIGATIWQASHTSSGESLRIVFALLWGILFVRFLAAWLYGRQAGGQLLLDCGPHPSRKMLLLIAVAFPALFGGLTVVTGSETFGIAGPVLLLSFSVFFLIMASGRLQVRENGVWQYCSLLRWARIESYHWADDGTCLVKIRGFTFLRRGTLPVPTKYRNAFDQLLQKHLDEAT